MAMYEYQMARDAFAKGVRFDPGNQELAALALEAERHAQYEAACQQRRINLQRRDLVLKLREVSLPDQIYGIRQIIALHLLLKLPAPAYKSPGKQAA
jgi:hypothetical protein